jgi:hypothetical protein
MKSKYRRFFVMILLCGLLGVTGCGEPVTPQTVAPQPDTSQPVTPQPVATQEDVPEAFELISQESLFAYLEDLTSLQPYSGWRNSATEGEAEALDYVADTLGNFAYLQDLGMEIERQSFHVLLSTEIWESRLYLTVNGQEIEVPADALRGDRYYVDRAMHFDSDGFINDSNRDSVEAQGEIIVIRSADEVRALDEETVQGRIVLFDYEAVDPMLHDPSESLSVMNALLRRNPAGIVFVTEFSDSWEQAVGSFLGEGEALSRVSFDVPFLYARLEDLAPAGITSWEDLTQIEMARVVWDTDVFSPGTSGNLIAHIPGADSSRAIILGAHIDSANTPGALDDGSGSVVLLEVARILNEAQIQPAVDVYLAWFGSEEIGLVGSQYFASTHQDLLDRTVAMMGIDGLYNFGPEYPHYVMLMGWSYTRFGNEELPFLDQLTQTISAYDLPIFPTSLDSTWPGSDNYVFGGFNVPNAHLRYHIDYAIDAPNLEHTPYDTLEIARQVSDGLEDLAVVALSFVLDVEQYAAQDLHTTPEPDRRALFVASHTEAVSMTPTLLIDFGMALAWEGFDVDMVPYGQPVTAADLEDTDLVVVLPVYDYASPETDDSYDEAWTESEIQALVDYVDAGGLLVLTNSASNFRQARILDPNEDWADMNDLSGRFGVVYQEGEMPATQISVQQPELISPRTLTMLAGNGVPFTTEGGSIWAQSLSEPAIVLLDYGDAGGQVLVLADAGILFASWAGGDDWRDNNLAFLCDLAQYAR